MLSILLPLITWVFVAIVLSLSLYFHLRVYSEKTANSAPAILTSIGIFGTFFGIALGLAGFDSGNIEASVPNLIEGLKTAFWSSIFGLFGALSIKLRQVLEYIKSVDTKNKVKTASISDLAALLLDIKDLIKDSGILNLDKSLSNSNQNLLAGIKDLKDGIATYQTEMAEANSTALINALETLLKDFNSQINVQYGENFLKLNEAVEQMIIWQNNYRLELQKLLDEQVANGELLNEATRAYAQMVKHTQAFDKVATTLGGVLAGLDKQSQSLGDYLQTLADLINNAGGGLPQLETRVMTLTEGLAKSVDLHQTQMQEFLTGGANKIKSSLELLEVALGENFKQNLNKQQELTLATLNRTEQQLVRMDRAMEQELTKALNSFGVQLASLSEKFIADYAPLTDKLAKIVQIGEDTTQKSIAKTQNKSNLKIEAQATAAKDAKKNLKTGTSAT